MTEPQRTRGRQRLATHDYSAAGAYFVTIVTAERRRLLGDIVAARSVPNAAGQMLIDMWLTLTSHHRGVIADAFIVMPDHVHGILWIGNASPTSPRANLPAVLGAFKSRTTCRYIDGVRHLGWPPFTQHLWQRSFYDRVIRNDRELTALREYIATNPARWAQAREFPNAR